MYTDTPNFPIDIINKRERYSKWFEIEDGYLCPFLKCPNVNCLGDLVWSKRNIEKENEKLECITCNFQIDSDEIRLSRISMRRNPPDILFTSIEFLNQNLSEISYRKLFGANYSFKSPDMVLLDEVHTYKIVPIFPPARIC